MMLKLHPDAKNNFDKLGESLINRLQVIPVSKKGESSFTQPHIAHNFEINETSNIQSMGLVNGLGENISESFMHQNQQIGLIGEAYKELQRLAENIQKLNGFQNTISKEFLFTNIFSWLKSRYLNQETINLTDVLLRKCISSIEVIEIWIPIAHLIIESEFKLGNITLRALTKEIFDNWEKNTLDVQKDHPERFDDIKQYYNKLRKTFQGNAVAIFQTKAEQEQGKKMAFIETEKAISLLRLFSSAMLFPQVKSYCRVFGKENVEFSFHFVGSEKHLTTENKSVIDQGFSAWTISNQKLQLLRNAGLNSISSLLREQNPSDFQDKLLQSLFIYSKASIANNLSDKIINTLTSLETLLLKDENEPIILNLSDRIAFLLGNTVDERKRIVKVIKEIYGLRSKLIHHGRTIDEKEKIKEYLIIVFNFYCLIIKQVSKYQTKAKFIEHIETLKFS
jgi:hypothetical protein